MKLERQLLINRECSNNNNYWSTGWKLDQQLLVNREWSYNHNYWSTGNAVRTTTVDQLGMKLEQQLLTKQGMKLE